MASCLRERVGRGREREGRRDRRSLSAIRRTRLEVSARSMRKPSRTNLAPTCSHGEKRSQRQVVVVSTGKAKRKTKQDKRGKTIEQKFGSLLSFLPSFRPTSLEQRSQLQLYRNKLSVLYKRNSEESQRDGPVIGSPGSFLSCLDSPINPR